VPWSKHRFFVFFCHPQQPSSRLMDWWTSCKHGQIAKLPKRWQIYQIVRSLFIVFIIYSYIYIHIYIYSYSCIYIILYNIQYIRSQIIIKSGAGKCPDIFHITHFDWCSGWKYPTDSRLWHRPSRGGGGWHFGDECLADICLGTWHHGNDGVSQNNWYASMTGIYKSDGIIGIHQKWWYTTKS
jgi:hypothetical protein